MQTKKCHLISHGISINSENIEACCLCRGLDEQGHPLIIENFETENFDWEHLLNLKDIQIEQLKNDELDSCKGCYVINQYECPSKGKFIAFINFNHWTHCNSNCIYCQRAKKPKPPRNTYNMMKSLIEKGLFNDEGEITFQGGEPTLLDEFDDLINLFAVQNTIIRVHTSGIKFSSALAKALDNSKTQIIISPDAGTPETYKKIKKVSKLEQVFNNAEKYISSTKLEFAHNVKLKYIIIPGYNDTIEEICEFFKRATKANVKSVIVDIEAEYYYKYKKRALHNIKLLLDFFVYKGKQLGIDIGYYDSVIYFKSKRSSKNLLPVENDTMYKFANGALRFLYKILNIDYMRNFVKDPLLVETEDEKESILIS